MRNDDDDNKVDKIFTEYLDFISSDEEADNYLRGEGHDPNQLEVEALSKIKQIQMQIASQKTEKQYVDLKNNLLQRAKDEVEKLLGDVAFNFESFIKKENINLAYRNFKELPESEIKELLVQHYLLKLENEQRNKSN